MNPRAFYGAQPLPSAEQLASELAADAEFTALQLGGFLDTPTGEFLAAAVGMAVPALYAPEFKLIVDALKLASQIQQGKVRGDAAWAAGALAVGIFALAKWS